MKELVQKLKKSSVGRKAGLFMDLARSNYNMNEGYDEEDFAEGSSARKALRKTRLYHAIAMRDPNKIRPDGEQSEDDDLIEISKPQMAAISKTMTKILNKFYEIEAIRDANLEAAEANIEDVEASKRESNLEKPKFNPGDMESSDGGGGISAAGLLSERLPELTEKLGELEEALDGLDLSSAGGGISGFIQGAIDTAQSAAGSAVGAASKGAGAVARTATRVLPKVGRAAAGLIPQSRAGKIAAGVAVAGGAAYALRSPIMSGIQSIGGAISSGVEKAATAIGNVFNAGSSEYAAANVAGARGDWARDTEFISEVNRVAQKFNIDANDLLGLMHSESGIRADIQNSIGATGLIQFMPRTASRLGTSGDQLRAMSRAQQMSYVERYFDMVGLPRGANAGQLYTAVFLPAFIRKDPLTVRGERYYNSNVGLDVNNDGAISQSDLIERVSRKRQEIGLGPSRQIGGFAAAANIAGNVVNNVGQAVGGAVNYVGDAIRGTLNRPALAPIRTRSGSTVQVAAPFQRVFQGFITDLENSGYRIRAIGGYSPRNAVGSNRPSYHSYGASIDINPAQNPYGQARITDMPVGLVQGLIRKWGLGWGLNWRSKSDAMHFSVARSEGGSVDIDRTTGNVRGIAAQTEVGGTHGAATNTSPVLPRQPSQANRPPSGPGVRPAVNTREVGQMCQSCALLRTTTPRRSAPTTTAPQSAPERFPLLRRNASPAPRTNPNPSSNYRMYLIGR